MKSIERHGGCGGEPPLAIFPGSLGDLICAAPALAALVERHGQLELGVKGSLGWLGCRLTGATPAPALEDHRWARLFAPAGMRSACAWLGRRPVVYSWLGATDDDFRRALSRLSIRPPEFHHVIRDNGTVHVSRQYMEEIEAPANEGSVAPRVRPVQVPRWGALASKAWGSGGQGPRLLVQPGSGSVEKCWEPWGFRAVMDWWRSKIGGVTLLLLGPAEGGQERHWSRAGFRTVSGLSIEEAASLIAGADLFLGNDSGISHLAGAVGARGAVIFGPTSPARWAPVGGELRPVVAAASPRRGRAGAAGGQAASGREGGWAVQAELHGPSGVIGGGISLEELPVEVVSDTLARLLFRDGSSGNQRKLEGLPP